MPVIVVGGDTAHGRAILEALAEPGREVRAFVTDEDAGAELKSLGVKVAIGDVSDDSHVQGAALRCFSAVLIAEAARDERQRSFAQSEEQVLRGWADAAAGSGVKRVIWVHDGDPPSAPTEEVAMVDPADPELVRKVVDLDEAQTISSRPSG